MVSIDDLKDLLLYKKPFFLPINPKDKKLGSAIFLLTPSRESSIMSMTKPYAINKNYFISYYVEKEITRIIQDKPVTESSRLGNYRFQLPITEFTTDSSLQRLEQKVSGNIVLSGYDNDITHVKIYLNKNSINDCFNRMNIKPPKKVNIIVTHNPDDPQEFTKDSVVLYTPDAFNKKYNQIEYSDYIKYTLQLYAIYSLKARKGFIKSDIVMSSLAEPAALVLSGVLDDELNKNKSNLYMERVMKYIIDKEGIDTFINILVSNDINSIFKYSKEYSKSISEGVSLEYFEMIREEAEAINQSQASNNQPPIAKPNVVQSEIDVKKTLKSARIKIKRRSRRASIYKLNKIRRDVENHKNTDKNGNAITADNPGGDVKTESLRYITNGDYVLEGNYVYLFEDSKYDTILKKALYNDRFKNDKDVLAVYDKIKKDVPFIKYTFINIERYKNKNLFVDLSYYNESFFRNISNLNSEDKANTKKLFEAYITLLDRLLNNPKINTYGKKTIFLPILEWHHNNSTKMWMYKEDTNPISVIYYMIKYKPTLLKQLFGSNDIIFLGGHNYFKINFSETDFSNSANVTKFIALLNRIIKLGYDNIDPDPEDDSSSDSPSGIAMELINKVEDSQNVEINDVSKISSLKKDANDKAAPNQSATLPPDNQQNETDEKTKKDAIVAAISAATKNSQSSDEALQKLNTDDFKSMVLSLQNDSVDNIRVDKLKASKVIAIQNEFHKKRINGMSVEELLKTRNTSDKLPVTSLKVASINKEWQNMTFMNFDKDYDVNADIIKMLDSMQYWTFPIAVKDIKIKDNSTSEDVVDLWTIECVDSRGHSFSLKVDIPKFIKHSNFLKLRGNEKNLMIQSALLPIIKTGLDECQIIGTGGYNKIFVRKFGSRTGQSMPAARNLLRTLTKYTENNNDIRIVYGNNKKVCTKYELPIDYIDLGQALNSIETNKIKIYFNQDELRKKYTVDDMKGIPIGVIKEFSTKAKKEVESILYFDGKSHNTVAGAIASLFMNNPKFEEIWNSGQIAGATCTYSKASILNTEIPIILICSYLEGLVPTLKKAGIKYSFESKIGREVRHSDKYDYIKFSDGYIVYEVTYASSLLMNGFKQHDTESYSLNEINKRMMYMDFFRSYGKFIESGLENSYDCMLDPITKEILAKYQLPTDYVSVLAYASGLLADNKYVKHIDQNGRRWRRKEVLAGYFYKALTTAYQEYSNSLRNNRKGTKMSIKQSAIIDLMTSKDPATTDLSINTVLNDVECANTVTNKGLVGMNVARGYTLNTRGYDDSMTNLLGMGTAFSGTVGINRQSTINANVEGGRGFVKTIEGDTSKMSVASTLTITEAVTPFGITHDDPQRTLMSYIQTAKHMMRCDSNDPMLITTGADEAMPYLASNTFAFKADQDGKVVEIVQEGFNKLNYMIIQYKDGSYEYVNLKEEVKKNSDGGYFVPLKLDTDLTKGSTFKAGDIIAYDKLSFSNAIGESGNLASTIGTLAKIAIINTDEGYEDAAAVTEKFAKKISTNVVNEISTRLSKGSNIFVYKKIGDHVIEGDTLFAYQADFDDDVANMLLKNLTIDSDQLSELGRNPVKTKYTGTVEDIVIYRTCELDDMSESLRKFVSERERKLDEVNKIYKKYKIDDSFIPKSGKVQEIGKAKGLEDAVMIIYYINHKDKLSIGDKIVYYSANKGTIKYMIPEGDEPYTEFRPNEPIDTFMSLSSISGRMTFSSVVFTATTKLMVELDRSIKDIAGIPWDDTKV